MKKGAIYLLFAWLILLDIFPLSAQLYDLSGLQGLKNAEGETFFELAGYQLYLSREKGEVTNHRSIRDIKKEYNLIHILAEYTDAKISLPNHVIEAERKLTNDRTSSLVCFLLQEKPNQLTVLHLETMNQRDLLLEQQLVSTYLTNQLTPYLTTNWTSRSLFIAGKTIPLDNTYKWEAPHHVTSDNGMIQWSEFPTMMEAELDINNHIDMDMMSGMEILSEEDVEILFDSIPTLAYRVAYRSYSPESYPETMICYYIAEKVREKYVSCVLGHFAGRQNDFNLSPLLRELIHIPRLPASAFIPEDTLEEELNSFEEPVHRSLINPFEVQAGTWIPVGRMSNIYAFAPQVGFFFGHLFTERLKADIGMQIAIPVNTHYFPYKTPYGIYDASAKVLFSMTIRGHYQWALGLHTFASTYVGIGVNGITTDLEKEYYDDDESSYYSCASPDLLFGFSIRYKWIGLFTEYHFLPYSMSSKIRHDFGNSAINIGLLFSF